MLFAQRSEPCLCSLRFSPPSSPLPSPHAECRKGKMRRGNEKKKKKKEGRGKKKCSRERRINQRDEPASLQHG